MYRTNIAARALWELRAGDSGGAQDATAIDLDPRTDRPSSILKGMGQVPKPTLSSAVVLNRFPVVLHGPPPLPLMIHLYHLVQEAAICHVIMSPKSCFCKFRFVGALVNNNNGPTIWGLC